MSTFYPGTVVRYGNDPVLYVRNSDGTWTAVYLGVAGVPSSNPFTGDSGRTDTDFQDPIARGAAQVVYASRPARPERYYA